MLFQPMGALILISARVASASARRAVHLAPRCYAVIAVCCYCCVCGFIANANHAIAIMSCSFSSFSLLARILLVHPARDRERESMIAPFAARSTERVRSCVERAPARAGAGPAFYLAAVPS